MSNDPSANPDPTPAPESPPAERMREAASVDPSEEQDLWEGSYSGKAMAGTWILSVIVVIAAVVATILLPFLGGWGWIVTGILALLLWGFILVLMFARKIDVHYKLTTRRLTHRHGILSRTTDHIECIDIDDVQFKQGIVERMFNVGEIIIISSDRSHPTLNMPGIANVEEVADLIDKTRRKERERRGLHIEAI